jgi:type IX secretion system PorP/SprF family membrane protein
MKRYILISAFFCSLALVAGAQDIHLSQFYAADHLMNPARVGDHSGDFRISANYRDQWRQIESQPLTTFVAAFDKAFHYYSHEIDGGIMVVRDQFSGFQSQTTKIFVTGAYSYLWKGNTLRGGVQSGIVSNSTDLSIQTFPEQWDYPNGTFDPSLPNMETSIRPSQMYVDVNLGLTWKRKIKDITYNGGIAVNHLNRPKDTYSSQVAERRRMRKVVHGGADIPLTPTLMLKPQFQWMWTTKANEVLLGSNIEHELAQTGLTKIWAGVFYRHGIIRTLDAVYPVVGVTYKRFDVGLSYDFNISSLSQGVKRVKSAEISVIYTAPSSKLKYRIVPCSRY